MQFEQTKKNWQSVAQGAKSWRAIENLIKKNVIEHKQMGDKKVTHVYIPSLLMLFAGKLQDDSAIKNDEFKMKLSFLSSICKWDKLSIILTYSVKLFWQLYTQRPCFRSTDYNPQFFPSYELLMLIKSLIKNILFIVILLIPIHSYAGKKDIVIVESYSKIYKWDADYCKVIKDKFEKKYNLTFFEMDTKQKPKIEHEKMGNKAWELIQKIKPILTIIGDDAALKFLGPRLEDNRMRAIYLGINNNPRFYFDKKPKYITGILERPLMRRSSLFIKDIIPKTKKVLILFDNDITSEIVYEDFFSRKPSITFSGVTYDMYLNKTFDEWQKRILKAPSQYDAIITGLHSTLIDENHKNVESDKVMNWSAQNTKIPLFAFWDFTIGKNKAMGGLVLTGTTQGKSASNLAEKLLNNPNLLPGSLFPIYLQEGVFVFSKYELNRFKIKLPNDIKDKTIFLD